MLLAARVVGRPRLPFPPGISKFPASPLRMTSQGPGAIWGCRAAVRMLPWLLPCCAHHYPPRGVRCRHHAGQLSLDLRLGYHGATLGLVTRALMGLSWGCPEEMQNGIAESDQSAMLRCASHLENSPSRRATHRHCCVSLTAPQHRGDGDSAIATLWDDTIHHNGSLCFLSGSNSASKKNHSFRPSGF